MIEGSSLALTAPGQGLGLLASYDNAATPELECTPDDALAMRDEVGALAVKSLLHTRKFDAASVACFVLALAYGSQSPASAACWLLQLQVTPRSYPLILPLAALDSASREIFLSLPLYTNPSANTHTRTLTPEPSLLHPHPNPFTPPPVPLQSITARKLLLQQWERSLNPTSEYKKSLARLANIDEDRDDNTLEGKARDLELNFLSTCVAWRRLDVSMDPAVILNALPGATAVMSVQLCPYRR